MTEEYLRSKESFTIFTSVVFGATSINMSQHLPADTKMTPIGNCSGVELCYHRIPHLISCFKSERRDEGDPLAVGNSSELVQIKKIHMKPVVFKVQDHQCTCGFSVIEFVAWKRVLTRIIFSQITGSC